MAGTQPSEKELYSKLIHMNTDKLLRTTDSQLVTRSCNETDCTPTARCASRLAVHKGTTKLFKYANITLKNKQFPYHIDKFSDFYNQSSLCLHQLLYIVANSNAHAHWVDNILSM